jgi:arylsulfatase A-like enzyme
MRPHLRPFLQLALVLSLSAASLAGRQPNLLFLFADDQCYETIAALGHTDIETPNLDRLAHQGTVFTHTYNMGGWNGALCIASRTMLNTGRFIWKARELDKDLKEEVSHGRLWSQRLRDAGYETFFTGKWHVKADTGQLFDYIAHVRPGMPGPVRYPEAYGRPIEGEPDPWDPTDPRFAGFWAGGTHWSEVIANDTAHFMAIAKTSARPFFMYVAFNAPHDPRQSAPAYLEKYPLERIKVPENYAPQYPYAEGANAATVRDELLAPTPRTEYAVKVHRREYYAIITHMDEQIGRILDALEASGQAENTYIIFTADHGLAVGHHGFIGKQNMYEHSLRPPLIIAGPGVPRGKRIDARVYLQDIMPTTLELAGIPVPDEVEFKSLLPLLRGEREKQYDYIFGAYEPGSQRAFISDDFKMIWYPKIDRYRLYNLKDDPHELNDLSENPAFADRLNRMKAAFVYFQRSVSDPLVVEN